MSKFRIKFYFVYKEMLSGGGAPDDYLMLANYLSVLDETSVSVVCDSKKGDVKRLNPEIELCDFSNRMGVVKSIPKSEKKRSVFVLISFSDLGNVRLAKALCSNGISYVLLPVSQVNDDLDYDNPFDVGIVPSISVVEKNTSVFQKGYFSRVREGKRSISAYVRKFKRVTYRRTLGRYLVNNSLAVGVFSEYEEKKLYSLVSCRTSRTVFKYFLGADCSAREYGDDGFFFPRKINITLWARVDFYYKGIDRLLNAFAELPVPIRKKYCLNIIGPNYNSGYGRTEQLACELGLRDSVRIYKTGEYRSGSVALLAKSDYILSASRWDGFPRSLREAAILGVPVIANQESNFDEFIRASGVGYVFGSHKELAQILIDICENKLVERDKSKAMNVTSLLSWENVSYDFNKTLRNIIGC